MADNIYIELELFLDPAITDPVALKKDLEQQISRWNKQVNANAKFKIKVARAREYINGGLADLDRQASEAKDERLRKLRDDIEVHRVVGPIGEDDLKQLRNRHKAFLSETTIQNEAQGVATPKAPSFTPPSCPNSLRTGKAISFAEMKRVQEDLAIVSKESGRSLNDLYDLLQLSSSASLAALQEKAKGAAEQARKMPKQDQRADPLNRLSGKSLNFFKDAAMREGYDVALKRFPFDCLCSEKLEIWANKDSGVPLPWKAYQMSIRDTVALGFTQSEAEWLVYDYYCNTKKRPEPIPEAETETPRPVETTGPSLLPKIAEWIKAIPASIRQPATSQPSRTASAAPKTTDPQTDSSVIGKFQTTMAWFVESLKKSHEPITSRSSTTQFDQIDVKRVLEEFRLLKKNCGKVQALSVGDLDTAFRHLDAMIGQLRELRPGFFGELAVLHKAVAERLGEADYQEERWGRALRSYKAIIDHHLVVGTAPDRIREIDEQRTKAFIRIEKHLACNDILGCLPIVNELERKFEGDPETEDFLRNKIKPKLATVQLSTKQIQNLIDEKKWHTLDQVLILRSPEDGTSLSELHKSVKKKLIQADEAVEQIRIAMSRKDMTKTKNLLVQLARFISDHAELGQLRAEFDFLWSHSAKINKKLRTLREQKHWVRAENVLRLFLATHSIKAIGLVGLTEEITRGVVRFQNFLRLTLFLVLGGTIFLVLSLFAARIFKAYQDDYMLLGFLSAIAFEFFVAYFVFEILIWALRVRADSPNMMRFGKAFTLFVCIAIFGSALIYMPTVQERFDSVWAVQKQGFDDLHLGPCVFHYVLPGLLLIGLLYPIQSFLYGLTLRCVKYEEEHWTLVSFLCGVVLFLLLMPVFIPKVQEVFGGKILVFRNPVLLVPIVWAFSWITVFVDYREERDSSFGLADIKDYFERYKLLMQLRNEDFGKTSLLSTDWYHSVKQEANFQQQQKMLELQRQQQAASVMMQKPAEPSPISIPSRQQSPQTRPLPEHNATPPVQNVPVPIATKVPVPMPPFQPPVLPKPPEK